MRRATKRRVRLFLRVVVAGVLIGTAYGFFTGLVFGRPPFVRALVGAIDGAAIAAPVGAMEMLLLRSRGGRRIQQAPFLVTFAVKWLVYTTFITAVIVIGPGARTLRVPPELPLLDDPLWRLGLLFAIVVTFAFVFVFELSQIVGPRNLRNVVLGRYHRPHVEERFFLFVDIAGSTPLAERLGASTVHRFLAMVFRLASDPIDDYGGEIYQYVGDEMVVTWTVSEVQGDAGPVACFFAIVAALDDAAPAFERLFGVAPRLRAALHAGTVISGEVGESKRDIVFHGDVMNTAARLEQSTRDLGRPFLVSADALAHLAVAGRYDLEPLGPQALRGRAAPVEVYALTARASR